MRKEDRNARFKRVAEKRTNDILERIRILGNCSNKSAYDYTNDQINKVFGEIERQLKNTRARFTTKDKKKRFIL